MSPEEKMIIDNFFMILIFGSLTLWIVLCFIAWLMRQFRKIGKTYYTKAQLEEMIGEKVIMKVDGKETSGFIRSDWDDRIVFDYGGIDRVIFKAYADDDDGKYIYLKPQKYKFLKYVK